MQPQAGGEHGAKPDGARVSAARVLDISWGLARTSALVTALEIGLFTRVAEGNRSPEQVAQVTGADPRGIEALMLALGALGLLTPSGDHDYQLAPDAAEYLVEGKSTYLGGLRHVHRKVNYSLWPLLTESVRTGKPAANPFGGGELSVWESVLPYLTTLSRPTAEWISGVIKQRPEWRRILDVGCGSGIYGHVIALRLPQVQVVGIDRPEVIDRATSQARDMGLAERVQYESGDLRAMAWGGPFDVVLMSNVLHGYDPLTCQDLIAQARRALRPGGSLLIHEFLPSPTEPPRNVMAALFGLEMLLTGTGMAYTYDRYHTWLTEVGFQGVGQIAPPAGPTSLIIAT